MCNGTPFTVGKMLSRAGLELGTALISRPALTLRDNCSFTTTTQTAEKHQNHQVVNSLILGYVKSNFESGEKLTVTNR